MADNITVSTAEGNREIRTREISPDLHGHVMFAGEHVRVFDGSASYNDSTSSQSLTSIPAQATHALIYNEGASTADFVRYWQTGTAPSSTVGKRLKDHEEMACASPSNFRFIRGSGTNTLRVEFYHYA